MDLFTHSMQQRMKSEAVRHPISRFSNGVCFRAKNPI
jgi:hypothetical protein